MLAVKHRVVRWVALVCSVVVSLTCAMAALDLATASQRVAVTWQNVVGVTATGNSLTKTAANGWGNAGASSVQTVSSDAFVEFTTAETHTAKAAGLSVGDTSQHDNDIDFAILADADGTVRVYESGQDRGQFGVYSANDVLRVEALEGVVRYYRNGALLYTSTLVPQFPARVDTALFHTNATINNVQLSDFNFSNVVGVDVLSPTSLRKTVGLPDQWGDSGAISTRSIKADTGYVEFQAGETTHSRMAGLSNVDTDQHFTTIQFGIRLPRMLPNGLAQVFENGILRFTDTVKYATTDVFRVEVIDNTGTPTVRYLKNGDVLYTSLQPVTYPLVLDTAFFHDGARLVNVSLHDTPGGDIPRDPLSGYAVPLTQADWDRVFAAAGVTPKTVNQSWELQDHDGDPDATIGSELTASTGDNAPSYLQPVTGWTRGAVAFSRDGGQAYLFQPKTIAVGPDPSVESALMFSYARVEKPASTRRIMVIAGGSTNEMLLGMISTGHLRLVCAGDRDDDATIGMAEAHGAVRPLFLQYDRTNGVNGVARAYSDQELIAGTCQERVNNSTRGFGTSMNNGRSGIQATLLAAQFRGVNAEWTEAEVRAVMNVLLPVGRTVPW